MQLHNEKLLIIILNIYDINIWSTISYTFYTKKKRCLISLMLVIFCVNVFIVVLAKKKKVVVTCMQSYRKDYNRAHKKK